MIKPSKVVFISDDLKEYIVTANNEVDLISAILEWFNHKNYERKFKH